MNFIEELHYGNIYPNENRNKRPLPYEIPSIDNSPFILARKLLIS